MSDTFHIIVISQTEKYGEETHWVNRLFDEGLEVFHLRKPDWNEEQYKKWLEKIDPNFLSGIMIHDHYHLVREFGLKGVHLPTNRLTERPLRLTTSCSAHSWKERLAIGDQVDYAFLSPFFDSYSKPGYTANTRLQDIPSNLWVEKTVALGGIDAGNISRIQDSGMMGVAMIGSIWNSKNPVQQFLEMKEQILVSG